MLAGRVELLQVPLRQTMEAQQQVVVILLQIRPGASRQCLDVVRVLVERLQHAQLQRQLAFTDRLPGQLHHSGHRAVGELWVKRCQGHLAHPLCDQTLQHLGQGRLAIAHGNLHRAMGPVLDHCRLQATGQHHKRRALLPPDRAIGVGRLLRALDQDQRHQQAPHRPRQVDHVRVHEELVEVAAHISHRGGGRGTQVDQQQGVIGHAASYVRGGWTGCPGPIANR